MLHRKKAFYHECGFHQVRTIVLGAESEGLSCFSVEPVRPGSVEAVRALQETHYLEHALCPLLAGNPPTRNAHRDGHDAETTASDGHSVVGGIALARQSAVRMAKVPEIAKGRFLDLLEQFIVRNTGKLVRRVIRRCETEFIVVKDVDPEVFPREKVDRNGCEWGESLVRRQYKVAAFDTHVKMVESRAHDY